MIQFFGVTRRFPTGQSALDGINLEIARGEFCFITGASGAGKTTLLKLIFREDVPTAGQILVNGRNVSLIPRQVADRLLPRVGILPTGESGVGRAIWIGYHASGLPRA